MKKIVLALLLFSAAGCASQQVATQRAPQGEFLEKCKEILQSLLTPRSRQFISIEDKQQILKILETWDRPEYGRLLNSSPEHFAVLIMESPEEIRQLYRNIPRDPEYRKLYFRELHDLLPIDGGKHLFHSFNDYMYRKLNSFGAEKFKDGDEVITDAAFIYRNLPAEKLAQVKQIIDDYWEHQLAKRYFEKNFFAELIIVTIEKKQFIKVQEELYSFKMKDGEYLLKVPRDKVRIRGDNPLDTKKLIAMTQAARLSAPKVYQGHLGLNGHFYLDDGNHRFSARETRDFVWINIGSRLRTLGLMHHLIYMGGGNPSDKLLLDLYHGKISVYDTLSEAMLRSMLWKENELVIQKK